MELERGLCPDGCSVCGNDWRLAGAGKCDTGGVPRTTDDGVRLITSIEWYLCFGSLLKLETGRNGRDRGVQGNVGQS